MIESWKVAEYGSEFPLESAKGDPVRDSINTIFLRSGRDALRYVASVMRSKGYEEALLPRYCCESMEWPFLDAGVRVSYYGIDENLKADLVGLHEKLERNRRTMLLYMNYYGCETIAEDELVSLKSNPELVLIKDATHDWLDYGLEGHSEVDDFTIVSLRKWAGLPEGGLVFSSIWHLESVAAINDSFASKRELAMGLKREYLETGRNELKDVYLKLLAQCNGLLDSAHDTLGMGLTSRALFAGVDWGCVADKRRENAQALADALKEAGVKCIHREGSAPLWVPFLPGCDRDELQKHLNAKNLYCPYLWPIPDNAKGCSDFIASFVDSMLCLPCDQRYDVEDMKAMVKILRGEIGP